MALRSSLAWGGFGGLFQVDWQNYQQPILVSGTDGVGTKLRLAMELGIHNSIGIDLVAMCVNDLLVCGAKPLFFLDYYATSHLDVDTATQVIAGISAGCEQAGAALIGGETAEMPGMYQAEDYDLAGFCVGIVDKPKLIDGHTVQAGDHMIAVGSSGPHSNGYSLIRKIIDVHQSDLAQNFEGQTLGECLLTPTKIYINAIHSLFSEHDIRAISHITGGGLTENLPRVLPKGVNAHINLNSWELPAIFTWLQQRGNIETEEMLRTFNCGIGLVLVVPAEQSAQVIAQLHNQGETAWLLGDIAPSEPTQAPQVIYQNG